MMSMHKKPLTDLEHRGLHAHCLPIDQPSQLSDAFRAGVAWAGKDIESFKSELEAKVRQNVQLMQERDAYRAAEEVQIALREKVQGERDALANSFCALQDAATDLIHASNENEAGDAIESIGGCGEKEARQLSSYRILIAQAEALEHRADCIMAEAGYLENFRREVAGILRSDAKDKRQQAEALK
ncbi:hypothetical protein [Halomonas sp. N3-2A]|uniref:hypothetical protein n=1 Tax=Halomonas sp. N3-2A TaxID=2014541 RepID=UPI000B5B353A|nr:hypothetical protein [Halomonas sp. N3-2A]ASK18431.1 hypothetical protein CEK60_03515 [Halomonas sp. N3-2A]